MEENKEKNVYFECEFDVDRAHCRKTLSDPASALISISTVLHYVLAAASLITALVSLLTFAFYPDTSVYLLLSFLCLLLCVICVLRFPPVRAAMYFRSIAHGKKSVQCRYVFDDDMIVGMTDGEIKNAYVYGNICAVKDAGDAFILRIEGVKIMRIPKSSFVYGDPDAFMSFILPRFKENNKYTPRFILSIAVLIFAVGMEAIAVLADIVLLVMHFITQSGTQPLIL